MKEFIKKIRLPDEKYLLAYMEGACSASAINSLLAFQDKQKKDRSSLSDYVRRGYYPLSPQMGGKLHGFTQDILQLFNYTDRKVTFYISSNPAINAFSDFNYNHDEPHHIVLNSGLVEKLTEDEIVFVIGHELGHLIYEHAVFNRVVNYIYPDETPAFLTGIYHLWANLSEMSADRVGLLAVNDIETAISAMFKISCGLDMMRLQVSSINFMDITNNIVTDMATSKQNFLEGSHPADSIRVKALDVFYHSKLRQSFLADRRDCKDDELAEKTDELISLLQKRPVDESEYAKLNFSTAAGYYLIKSDEEITVEEHDGLMNILSNFHYWPSTYARNLMKDANPMEVIDKAAAYIVDNSPQDALPLFNVLIPLITKDRKFCNEEIHALLIISEKLKLSESEAVGAILECIKYHYRPLS